MTTIVDYASLQTAVGSWLHRSTALSANIPDFIRLGEIRIYRELTVRQMEAALSVAITSGLAAVPSDYMNLKFAYVSGTTSAPLERKDAEWIYRNYPTRSGSSTPKFIARDGSNFIFGPWPADGTLKGSYYAQLAALSNTNTTNWLITDSPDLILWAALAEAAPFVMDDARAPMWDAKYQNAKRAVQRESDDEEFSGSPLASTVR